MTTIKFLGYDLELVEALTTSLLELTLVSVLLKLNNRKQYFSARTHYSNVSESLSDIELYSLIASDIEDEMIEWVNSLT